MFSTIFSSLTTTAAPPCTADFWWVAASAALLLFNLELKPLLNLKTTEPQEPNSGTKSPFCTVTLSCPVTSDGLISWLWNGSEKAECPGVVQSNLKEKSRWSLSLTWRLSALITFQLIDLQLFLKIFVLLSCSFPQMSSWSSICFKYSIFWYFCLKNGWNDFFSLQLSLVWKAKVDSTCFIGYLFLLPLVANDCSLTAPWMFGFIWVLLGPGSKCSPERFLSPWRVPVVETGRVLLTFRGFISVVSPPRAFTYRHSWLV